MTITNASEATALSDKAQGSRAPDKPVLVPNDDLIADVFAACLLEVAGVARTLTRGQRRQHSWVMGKKLPVHETLSGRFIREEAVHESFWKQHVSRHAPGQPYDAGVAGWLLRRLVTMLSGAGFGATHRVVEDDDLLDTADAVLLITWP